MNIPEYIDYIGTEFDMIFDFDVRISADVIAKSIVSSGGASALIPADIAYMGTQ
jgi:hypothetical protein